MVIVVFDYCKRNNYFRCNIKRFNPMIQPKEKKCKAIGKSKGFEGCGKLALRRTYGLCMGCYSSWLLSTPEGQQKIDSSIISGTKKAKKEHAKEERAKDKKEKDENTEWDKMLQVEINKLVRLIDGGLLCLAVGRGGQIHAGHIFSRGSNQTIKYNLHNIHRQNAQSNHFQNDDGLLREGLRSEYGDEYFEFVSALRRTPALHYNNMEYMDFTLKARKIVSKLTKSQFDYPLPLKVRIRLRSEINKEMNIYKEVYCIYEPNLQ